jgi:hypothetical protein
MFRCVSSRVVRVEEKNWSRDRRARVEEFETRTENKEED